MPETITVDSGEFRQIDIHDDYGGEMTDVLIDITADDASVRIDATGGDSFVMRNVGVKGVADNEGLHDSNMIKPRLDSGETGVIEHCYFGDGCYEGDGEGNNGIQYERESEGTLEIIEMNLGYFDDNGIYCSDPGDTADEGGNGQTHIRRVLSQGSNISQVRIGGDGSTIRDSVLIARDGDINCGGFRGGNRDCGVRGMRFEEGSDLLAENVHITTDGRAIQMKDGAQGTFRDGQFIGEIDDGEGDLSLVNNGSSPTASAPSGVPMTADEAANGTSSAPGIGNEMEDPENEIGIYTVGPSGTNQITYSITANEQLFGWTISDTVDGLDGGQLEDNITINDNGDGTWTATGGTGGGFGDAFATDGQLISYSISGGGASDAHIEVNGTTVTQEDLPYPTEEPVEPPNEKPTAAISLSTSTPQVNQSMTMDASGSSDPDGEITSYTWTVGTNTYAGEVASHTFSITGEHAIDLRVQDDDGATDSTTEIVTVQEEPEPPNEGPVASFSISNESPTVGQSVSFDASSSSDPDGSVSEYNWNIEDSTRTGVSTSYTFDSPGDYAVTLTVTDNDGATSSESRTLTVSEDEPERSPFGDFVEENPVIAVVGLGVLGAIVVRALSNN